MRFVNCQKKQRVDILNAQTKVLKVWCFVSVPPVLQGTQTLYQTDVLKRMLNQRTESFGHLIRTPLGASLWKPYRHIQPQKVLLGMDVFSHYLVGNDCRDTLRAQANQATKVTGQK